eukprot:scaffold207592_cov46-Prasinocladus_malaysianus.AAC.1
MSFVRLLGHARRAGVAHLCVVASTVAKLLSEKYDYDFHSCLSPCGCWASSKACSTRTRRRTYWHYAKVVQYEESGLRRPFVLQLYRSIARLRLESRGFERHNLSFRSGLLALRVIEFARSSTEPWCLSQLSGSGAAFYPVDSPYSSNVPGWGIHFARLWIACLATGRCG